jgi:hypothetical protein
MTHLATPSEKTSLGSTAYSFDALSSVSRLCEVAEHKTSLENESQPSCLGAVIRCKKHGL